MGETARVLVNIAVSAGAVISSVTVASAAYNHFQYSKMRQSTITGVLLGILSFMFNFLTYNLGAGPAFDYRFVLLIAAGAVYYPAVVLWMSPFYIAGMLFTYSMYSIPMVLLAAAFTCVYVFAVSAFGLPPKLRAVLLIGGATPIALSLPLIAASADLFDSKTILMYGGLGVLAGLALAWIFAAAIRQNIFGLAAVTMYVQNIFSRFSDIHHFLIDRKRKRVRFSERFHDVFELSSPDKRRMEYREFLSLFAYALDDVRPDTPLEKVILNGSVREHIYVTPKTNQNKYISFVCRRRFFGGYSGQIRDLTNDTAPETILHNIMKKDHTTGFATYYVMKEEMVEAAAHNAGLMLQINFMVNFTQTVESIYGYEIEKEYFRIMAGLLRSEFPDAMIYSVKTNEFQMLVYNIEKTENAVKYSERLRDFFLKPFDISGKLIYVVATVGLLVSEALRCDSVDKANGLIHRAIFAKETAYQKKPGSIYYFREEDYIESLEQHRRSEWLPVLIRNGMFTTVFQPIIRVADASVFAYEALTRARDGMYSSTEQLIIDAHKYSMERELDIAMVKNLLKTIVERSFPSNLFVNKLLRTPVIDEFKTLAGLLKNTGHLLYIEFTEYMEYELADFLPMAAELSSHGIRIAIDDYGKGYSSQSLISNINPSLLKIDRELISGIDKNKRKETLVKGIVEYCDFMGIECLAEGVSRSEEMNSVISLGVHYMQGYYLRKPDGELRDIPGDIRDEILRASAARRAVKR